MKIIDHQQLSESFFRLTIESKEIALHARPGQFVNIRCGNTTDPLLRRPFAIHKRDKERMVFDVLYETVGKGTGELNRRKIGERLDVAGPLGNGFNIDPQKKIAILIAGGAGIAPLPFLTDHLLDKAVYVIVGFKKQENIVCIDDIKEMNVQTIITTDDGSAGKKGFSSDLLLSLLDDEIKPQFYETTTIFSCGPRPMLKEVAAIALAKNIACQVSIEQKMACGFGVCLGCSIPTKNGYKLACKDGPVFDAAELLW